MIFYFPPQASLPSLGLILLNLVRTLPANLDTLPLEQEASLDTHLSRDSCKLFPSHQD